MADYIDWSKLAETAKTPSYENIANILTTAGKSSFLDKSRDDISKYLQPGADPYLQEAINQIVAQGKESKKRAMSDVATAAQRRGISGSSIETGDIAQTAYQSELGQQGQISGLLAQDASSKNQQMVNFLTQAYGLDFQTAMGMANNLAQLMGQEFTRKNDMEIARMTSQAYKDAQPSFLESIAPSAITALPALLSLSDRRAKENIKKIRTIGGIPFYHFNYKGGSEVHVGVMSDEVRHIPDAVSVGKDGYDRVDYSKVLEHMGGK